MKSRWRIKVIRRVPDYPPGLGLVRGRGSLWLLLPGQPPLLRGQPPESLPPLPRTHPVGMRYPLIESKGPGDPAAVGSAQASHLPMTPEDQPDPRRRRSHPLTAMKYWPWRQGGSLDEIDSQPAAVERHRQWSSRQLHHLGDVTSHAWAGVMVALIVVAWLAYGAASGFPPYWLTVLESSTSIVTVFMVFAIQHLQGRDQIVTQRKLDELLRAVPRADNKLIAVEDASDEELEALTERNRQDRLDGS